MKSTTLLIAAAASALLAGVSSASAKIVTVTLTGDSENVFDRNNVFGFGASDTPITDKSFVETFTIDTTADSFPPAPDNRVSFNSIFSSGPPYAVGGSLSIGGSAPFTTLGSDYSSVFTQGDYQILSDDKVSTASNTDNEFYLDLTGLGLPTTVNQSFSMTLTAGEVANNSFEDETSQNELPDAIGNLYPTSITISAAPEPASWALMILGVGMAGGLLRQDRRRRWSAAANA